MFTVGHKLKSMIFSSVYGRLRVVIRKRILSTVTEPVNDSY